MMTGGTPVSGNLQMNILSDIFKVVAYPFRSVMFYSKTDAGSIPTGPSVGR